MKDYRLARQGASLRASVETGTTWNMTSMRKITIQVPEALLHSAQKFTGEGITATVAAGLKRLASMQAQHELLKLRGKVKFSLTTDEMRYDGE